MQDLIIQMLGPYAEHIDPAFAIGFLVGVGATVLLFSVITRIIVRSIWVGLLSLLGLGGLWLVNPEKVNPLVDGFITNGTVPSAQDLAPGSPIPSIQDFATITSTDMTKLDPTRRLGDQIHGRKESESPQEQTAPTVDPLAVAQDAVKESLKDQVLEFFGQFDQPGPAADSSVNQTQASDQ